MRILLICSTARGHAIAESLSKSSHQPEIVSVCPNENPGVSKLSKVMYTENILDMDRMTEIAKSVQPDFAFIGPDDPIGLGLADRFEEIGIQSVAPKKSLARIEASKGFTRDLMQKYGIDASPLYKVFTNANESAIRSYLEDLEGNFVVKYDALKGGKGVKVSGEHLHSIDEGVQYAIECVQECGRVVVEEKLVGVEFSLISFVSGTAVVDTPAIQDHKRANVGDTGPNTGGMGTYSDANHSLPFLSDADLNRAKEINGLTAEALLQECGEPYKGLLYGGFIVVKNGVRVIEYNARFGDPEALNILPLLETDFVDICQGILSGELSEDVVSFEKKATVCKYITPDCYPESKDRKGEKVTFPDMTENARIYYGDISEDYVGSMQLGGSRTAGIVGIGDSIAEAERVAEDLCAQVQGPVRYRSDIGTEDLVSKRSEMIREIRSA